MKIFKLLFFCCLFLFLLLSITPHAQSSYAIQTQHLQKEVLFVEHFAYMGENILGAYSDKYRHILAFLLLGILFDLSYFFTVYKKIAFLISYGIFIELVQVFVPYREGDLFDIIINTSAIFFYFFITRVVLKNYFHKWYMEYQRSISG